MSDLGPDKQENQELMILHYHYNLQKKLQELIERDNILRM